MTSPLPPLGRSLVVALATGTALTLAIAWPVVLHPATLAFGSEVIGRHHDAYTVILQFGGGSTSGIYAQALTDRAGWLLAKIVDPVVAFNIVVLASFPLAMLTTYALARYLFSIHLAALVAGAAFAFAPSHLAHAAYHAHVAQVQWLPLYLLALFGFVDRPSATRGAGLAVAAAAVSLSNFYGGLIAAVITLPAVGAYWWASPRGARRVRSLALTLATLAAIALTGAAGIAFAAPDVLARPAAYAVPVVDLVIHSARWWSYLIPPVDHPQLGALAARTLSRGGVTLGLLENQVSIGWALLVVSAAGLVLAVRDRARDPRWRTGVALVVVGLVAAVVSLGPGDGRCTEGSWAPACAVYRLLPMFRAYARFSVAIQLVVALLAGAGAARLASVSMTARAAAALLVAIAVYEAWPFPWRAHDILPTQAHRWLADRPAAGRILDCVRPAPGNESLALLMKRPIEPLGREVLTCADPNLGPRIAALGFTHVIVWRRDGGSRLAGDSPEGIRVVARLADSAVYAVTATPEPIVTVAREGFAEVAGPDGVPSAWIGSTGSWTVRNTTTARQTATLSLRLATRKGRWMLLVSMDGAPALAREVTTAPADHVVGPWSLYPGDHRLEFRVSEAAGSPGDGGLLPVNILAERWIQPAPDSRR